MNREIKRRLKRDREAKDRLTPMRPAPGSQRRERVKLRQFVREVQGELRRVIWPTRTEVITYSIVVVVVVLILTVLVFGLDLGFAKGIVQLFRPSEVGVSPPPVPLPNVPVPSPG